MSMSQGRGYGAVVVTTLMSQQLLVALNEAARGVGAAFVLGSQLRINFKHDNQMFFVDIF